PAPHGSPQTSGPTSSRRPMPQSASTARHTALELSLSSSPPPTDPAVEGTTVPRKEEAPVGVVHRDGGDVVLICQVACLKKGAEVPRFVIIPETNVIERVRLRAGRILAVDEIAVGHPLDVGSDPES